VQVEIQLRLKLSIWGKKECRHLQLPEIFAFSSDEQVIGLLVCLATVGAFVMWYTHGSFLGIDLIGDGHTLVIYNQFSNWGQCSSWEGFKADPFTAGDHVFSFDNNPCDYFTEGKAKATTISLFILVAVEMYNSLNALSDDASLLTMPPHPVCPILHIGFWHHAPELQRVAAGLGHGIPSDHHRQGRQTGKMMHSHQCNT
jgi:hypothetical protein